MSPSSLARLVFLGTNLVVIVVLLWCIRLQNLGPAPNDIAHRYPIIPILACASAFVLLVCGLFHWIGSLVDRSKANARYGQGNSLSEPVEFSPSALAADVVMRTVRVILVLPALIMLTVTMTRASRFVGSDDPFVRQELLRIAPLDGVIAVFLTLFVLFARVPGLVHDQRDDPGEGAGPDA